MRSLIHHGFAWDILTWRDWPNEHFDTNNPYHIKAAAFEQAIKLGYKNILWLDCSVWAVKNPHPIFDVLEEEGYYFWRSGYNCAQVCSDACLQYFGVDRDLAEQWPDCSTSMFGVNLEYAPAQEFIERWIQAAKDGAFNGSREHDGQSDDPRFQFHRQDQSCASIILNQLGLAQYAPGVYSAYYQKQLPDSVIFTMQGL